MNEKMNVLILDDQLHNTQGVYLRGQNKLQQNNDYR